MGARKVRKLEAWLEVLEAARELLYKAAEYRQLSGDDGDAENIGFALALCEWRPQYDDIKENGIEPANEIEAMERDIKLHDMELDNLAEHIRIGIERAKGSL